MWYDDHRSSFMPEIDSPMQNNNRSNLGNNAYQYPNYGSCKKELDHLQNYQITPSHCLQLPLLEGPKLHSYGIDVNEGSSSSQTSLLSQDLHNNHNIQQHQDHKYSDQVMDWRVLDKFVASQLLNQGDVSVKENHDQSYNPNTEEQIIEPEDASNSIYSDRIDLWK